MKILIALVTCHRYHDRARAVRETWAKDVPSSCFVTSMDGKKQEASVDMRFFLGRSDKPYEPAADEIVVDVNDGYKELPSKSRELFRWALHHGYDFVYKCDDDSFVVPQRLLASGFEQHDYVGRLRGPSGGFPAPYASGFGYWLSGRAMRLLIDAADQECQAHTDAEDRWVGNRLLASGIECHLDPRYVVVKSVRNATSAREAPRPGNDVIAACEFQPSDMRKQYQLWRAGEKSKLPAKVEVVEGPFSRVSVLIKTFLRDGFLVRTAAAIEKHLPGMKMIIVDDGYESRDKIKLYAELRTRGHVCHWLPFDSGFGAKANAGIRYMDRQYTLIGCDDFDFAATDVPGGIKQMVAVLDADPEVSSVAGRVDNRPYETFIEHGPDYIREIAFDPKTQSPRQTPEGVKYYLVDQTVNYNMVRAKMLGPGRVTWVENKIGCDHFDFYYDLRIRGTKIAWIPGVNIRQQHYDPGLQHQKYGNYRGRAKLAIPGFLQKFGIERYIASDGREDRL